jgi:hypothetical protein
MMKRFLGFSLALFVLMLIPLGCGDSSDVTGKWSIDSAAMKDSMLGSKAAGLSDAEKKEMENNPMVKGMLEMFDKMTMDMELKADGTCSSTATVMQKTESTSGTWKMEGDILSITMKTMDDEDAVEETKKFNVEGDRLAVILSEEEKKTGMPAFVFIRK